MLTGPGHVVLQSMPILNLAEEIAHYLPGHSDTGASSSSSAGVAVGAIGGFLGSILDGDKS